MPADALSQGPFIQRPPREASPRTAEVAADLDFPLTGLHLSALTQGPAVMIGRPPPPAAPKSGPPCDRLCHSKVAGQDTACRVVERASSTLRRPKTQDKCQSLRTEGALDRVDDLNSLRLVLILPDNRSLQSSAN
jgi:hypothetical protein